MKKLRNRPFWLVAVAAVVLGGAGLWFACDPAPGPTAAVPSAPAAAPSTPDRGTNLEGVPTEAAQQAAPFDEQAARVALRMVAIAKLFHGNDWADHLPTSQKDRDAVYANQSAWMASDQNELHKGALDIIANPIELAAWQRRLGDVVLTPKEVQRFMAARERVEQHKADLRKRLEEKRRNNPGGEGGFQGADACGGGGLLGLPGVQDDADCGYCTDDCFEEADRRLAGLYYWQETVCEEYEDDEDQTEYDICIAETQEVIDARFDQYFEECCNSNCHTCPPGWCRDL